MGLLDKINSVLGVDSGEKKIESASEQTNDERNLISHIRQKVEESRSSGSRITNEGIWMTNIAYLMGFDGVFYDTTTRQYKTTGRSSGGLKRNRMHVNKILPTVQNRQARLCKNKPKYDVRPKSEEPEDKEAAELSLKIVGLVWDEQKVNRKRQELMMWAQQCGHSYFKVSFDDQLGEQMVDPTNPEDISYEGAVRVDVVSGFEIFPDPLAKTLDEAQWVCQAKVRKLDYFKTHYPDRGDLVKEETAWLLSAQYETRINQLNQAGPTTSGTQMALKNSAIELSYYERRSKKHPNGRLIITANGVLLEDKELPIGEIPFAKFDDVIIGGKYYSESIITHLRPVQDQYNRLMQTRAEWTNRMLKGKFIAAKGHGLIQEALNDQNGEVVEYDPIPGAAEPRAMEIPAIPAYAYKEEESLQSNIFDISGINEASRGQLPSASIPALGMQMLVEQDDTRIGVVTDSHEEAYAVTGSLILKYVEKFYTMPRLIKELGSNNEYTIKKFTGESIRGNTDVVVIPGSTLPGSKVLRRQEVMNMYQQGLLGPIGDPKTIQKLLEMLEYGDVAAAWKGVHLDEQKSNRSIDELKQGLLPEINEFDSNDFIFQKVNDYRKENEQNMDDQEQARVMLYLEGLLQSVTARANPNMFAAGPGPQGIAPKPPMPPMMGGSGMDMGAPPMGQAPGNLGG